MHQSRAPTQGNLLPHRPDEALPEETVSWFSTKVFLFFFLIYFF